MNPKTSAVFDCMVFLQGAARRDGPSGKCLQLVEAGVVELHLSAAILAEINDVLRRPRIVTKFPSLTDELVSQYVGRLTELAAITREVPATVSFDRDPKDAPYLDLAIASKVEYLVSRDHDLLSLAEPSQSKVALVIRGSGVRVIDPVAFLALIRERHL